MKPQRPDCEPVCAVSLVRVNRQEEIRLTC